MNPSPATGSGRVMVACFVVLVVALVVWPAITAVI